MTASKPENITLICATYNRIDALKYTLSNKLAINGVVELIFVVDGSDDGSREYLEDEAKNDNRIRVLYQENMGAQQARNSAIAVANSPWLLFLDDDDFAPADFATILHSAAISNGAVIAGAPWMNCVDKNPANAWEDAKTRRKDSIELRDHPSTVTKSDQVTPFLFSSILISADVASRFRYDAVFRGNSWREETDLFLRVYTSGERIVRSARTYSWTSRRFGGGNSGGALRYEYWIIRNEALFLRRHRQVLQVLQPTWRGVAIEVLKTSMPRIGDRLRAYAASRARILGGASK